jgi:hypothetical protein
LSGSSADIIQSSQGASASCGSYSFHCCSFREKVSAAGINGIWAATSIMQIIFFMAVSDYRNSGAKNYSSAESPHLQLDSRVCRLVSRQIKPKRSNLPYKRQTVKMHANPLIASRKRFKYAGQKMLLTQLKVSLLMK